MVYGYFGILEKPVGGPLVIWMFLKDLVIPKMLDRQQKT